MAIVAHMDRDVARGEPFISLCLLSIEATGNDNERVKGGGLRGRGWWRMGEEQMGNEPLSR